MGSIDRKDHAKDNKRSDETKGGAAGIDEDIAERSASASAETLMEFIGAGI